MCVGVYVYTTTYVCVGAYVRTRNGRRGGSLEKSVKYQEDSVKVSGAKIERWVNGVVSSFSFRRVLGVGPRRTVGLLICVPRGR